MRDPNADILDESRPTKRKKTMEFLRAVDPQELGLSAPAAPISGPNQHFCGFRLKIQTIPSEILQSSLQDRELLPLEKLEERVAHVRRFWRNKSIHSGDLVIVGVVCHIWRRSLDEAKLKMVEREYGQPKSPSPAPLKNQVEIEKLEDRQMSKLSKSRELGEMMVVRVTDLRRNSICIALDPRFKRDLLKYGSVVAILNPKFVHALDGDGVVLQVEKESQLCVVGQSSDIGICRYRKPTSKPSSTLSPLSSSLLPPLPNVQPPSCSTSVATSPEDSTFGASTAAAEIDPALIASPKLSTQSAIASPIAADTWAPQAAPSTATLVHNHSTYSPTPCSASHGNAKTSSKSFPLSLADQEICPNFIDLSVSEYCDYHMYIMFSEQKSNRMVLNDPGGGSLSSLQKRSEISEAAKHLSDGVFALCQLKWKISTRNVKLAPSNDLAVAPSASQMYVELVGRNKMPLRVVLDDLSAPL
jgi:hypothetical protein